MPINASYEYIAAEKKYLQAEGLENKIAALEEMIRCAPDHKGAENLRAELKARLRKFKEKLEKGKKIGKGKKGIRKEGFQVALVGKTNTGKSLLLSKLTNAFPKVSEHEFTTNSPELGTMDYQNVRAQIVDLPSVGSKDFDWNVVNSADCLLVVVTSIDEIWEVEEKLGRARGKRIIAFNKIDKLGENGARKLEQQIRAKRIKDYVLVSAKNGEGVEKLMRKIISNMGAVRVFTKEPGKPKNEDPVVLSEGSTIEDVAETIYKGFSRKVKETRLTGPSGKFSNQRVGLKHKVKDMDVVEFRD